MEEVNKYGSYSGLSQLETEAKKDAVFLRTRTRIALGLLCLASLAVAAVSFGTAAEVSEVAETTDVAASFGLRFHLERPDTWCQGGVSDIIDDETHTGKSAAQCADKCAATAGCSGFLWGSDSRASVAPQRCTLLRSCTNPRNYNFQSVTGATVGYYAIPPECAARQLSINHPTLGTDTSAGACTNGHANMASCDDYCDSLDGCKGFWYYDNGRCCPKASWTAGSFTRVIAEGGAFYGLDCPCWNPQKLSNNHPLGDVSAGACTDGNENMGACDAYCDSLQGCTGFWYYNSGPHDGRCCPKKSWTANSFSRAIQGGAFYGLTCPTYVGDPYTYHLSRPDTWCQGSSDIIDDEYNTGKSVAECADKCKATAGCAGFLSGDDNRPATVDRCTTLSDCTNPREYGAPTCPTCGSGVAYYEPGSP